MDAIDLSSAIVGWIYFVAWSVSFYPQIWINFKRKSVVGLNFDFLALNFTGFLFYSIFNICLYYIPSYQAAYEDRFPKSSIPVELNDVVFSLHALFATVITIMQCLIYERGGQRPSYIAIIFVAALYAVAVILLGLVLSNNLHKLDFTYYFSYSKLVITIIKYIPQAWFNYRRKSTIGWSIGNILLDITGGTLSILQMILLAYKNNDWINIFGNFTKFGLGMVSILFDVLFIVQHYVLYTDRQEGESDHLSEQNDAKPNYSATGLRNPVTLDEV